MHSLARSHTEVAVLDIGLGNCRSVANMMRRVGALTELVTSPEQLRGQALTVIPGVGSFDAGMSALEQSGWADFLPEYLSRGGHVLGICLGMQLLGESSEEGSRPGLGLIPMEFKRFIAPVRVPHMGWNEVAFSGAGSLTDESASRYYFAHSYYAVSEAEIVAGSTLHGHWFPSYVKHDSMIGVQFHPEKSHQFGLDFFASLMGEAQCWRIE